MNPSQAVLDRRASALCAMAAVAGNILGVVLLGPVRLPYRLSGLEQGTWWLDGLAHPGAVTASAWFFVAGLTALGLWALRAAQRFGPGPAWYGSVLLAFGSFADALGSLLPWVAASRLGPGDAALGGALLSTALAVDSFFNVTLALGLPLIAWGLRRQFRVPAGLWVLALLGGFFSLVPSFEIIWDFAALGLLISSPCWLAFFLWVGIRQVNHDF